MSEATQQPGNPATERLVIGLAITAALVRLIPLQWLHPINWDEIEFFRVVTWIAEGRVPFRDFWEHHTPLGWYAYAPVAALTKSPGVAAILALRWAQIPVWIAAFFVAHLFMRNAGLSRFARWAATAIALASSFLMLAAVEIRLDPLAALFYMTGLVLVQRGKWFAAGAAFCVTGLTNMRLGPLLVATVLLLSFVDLQERRWRWRMGALRMYLGGIATLALALLWFFATDSLQPMFRQLFTENVIGDKYGETVAAAGGFVHRLLVPFGVRLIATDRLFELAAVDFGGILILLFGLAGIVLALGAWRTPDDRFVLAVLQIAGVAIIAGMNFIYNYHFITVVLMMLPLMAIAIERIPRRGAVIALLAVAWCVNAFASVFRGKELDLAYQDFIMREVHARTLPSERFWAGSPWGLRREPAYWFWFLPDMTRHLVRLGEAEPYRLERVLRDPPAVVVFDHYAKVWVSSVQRELARYFVRHYVPVWRNLWIPGMNARVPAGGVYQWIAPRDGVYRVFASPQLATHVWFRDPLYVGAYDNADPRVTLTLPEPGLRGARLNVEGAAVADASPTVTLRKGQRVAIQNTSAEVLGVILLSGNDRILFRQPPGGATLEAASTRVTHVPRLGARIEP